MSWFDWLFGTKEINKLKLDIVNLQLDLTDAQEDLKLEKNARAIAEAKLKKQEIEEEQEIFWNAKYAKQNIYYQRRETDGQYEIDVRNYFMPFDSSIPTISGATNDEKAFNSLVWVKNNIVYISDKQQYGFDEYWAYAYQTLIRRKGDCEDGALLMANIMLKSGIPYWRIRLNAGDVKGGGHAYVTYCRETDNQFVTLDWCYWFDETAIKERKLHNQQRDYYGIWFSWNLKYSFGSGVTYAGFTVE